MIYARVALLAGLTTNILEIKSFTFSEMQAGNL